jgi:hypothetical protein
MRGSSGKSRQTAGRHWTTTFSRSLKDSNPDSRFEIFLNLWHPGTASAALTAVKNHKSPLAAK